MTAAIPPTLPSTAGQLAHTAVWIEKPEAFTPKGAY